MIEFGKGEEFYELANADGKRWLVPRRGLGVALCLYQPSGFRGKLLKRFYPLLHLSAVRRRLGVAVRHCQLNEDFAKLVGEAFGIAPTSFASRPVSTKRLPSNYAHPTELRATPRPPQAPTSLNSSIASSASWHDWLSWA